MAVALFVYGTLMSPQVLKVLLGRVPPLMEPAILKGRFRRHPVLEQVYPGLIVPYNDEGSSGISTTRGMLLQEIKPHELQVLDWFEGDDYEKHTVEVQTLSDVSCQAQVYLWCRPRGELDLQSEWNFSDFEERYLEWYLTNVVRPCREELDILGIGKVAK